MPVNWNRKKYSKEELTTAVKNSISWRQVATKLGMNPDAGGIYHGIKIAAKDIDLSTDHFLGQSWNRGDVMGLNRNYIKIPTEKILIKDSTYLNTSNLKKRLIKENLLVERCYAPYCPVPNPSVDPFTGEPTPLKLALDHINGVRGDNRITNLRLLCYHCHGLTDTWCTKNIRYQADVLEQVDKPLLESGAFGRESSNLFIRTCTCGKSIGKKSKNCKSCALINRDTVIDWPSDSDLLSMLEESNFSAVGGTLGVSDNAIRHRLQRRNLL